MIQSQRTNHAQFIYWYKVIFQNLLHTYWIVYSLQQTSLQRNFESNKVTMLWCVNKPLETQKTRSRRYQVQMVRINLNCCPNFTSMKDYQKGLCLQGNWYPAISKLRTLFFIFVPTSILHCKAIKHPSTHKLGKQNIFNNETESSFVTLECCIVSWVWKLNLKFLEQGKY